MRNQAARKNGHDFDNPQSRLLEAIASLHKDIDVDKDLTWKPEVTTLQTVTKLLCSTYVLNMCKEVCVCVEKHLEKNHNAIDTASLKESLEAIMREQMSAINLLFSHRYNHLGEGNPWDPYVVLESFKKKYIAVLQDIFARKLGAHIVDYRNETMSAHSIQDKKLHPHRSL